VGEPRERERGRGAKRGLDRKQTAAQGKKTIYPTTHAKLDDGLGEN